MNLALNPDFPFRILFHTFTIFLQSCNLIPAWKAPRPRYLIHSSRFGHINIGLSILMQTCKRLINRWRGHYHNCHHQSPQDKEDWIHVWIHVWSVALSLGGPTCTQYMYLPEYSRLKIYCRTLTHNHQMHLLKAGKFQVYLSHVLVACTVWLVVFMRNLFMHFVVRREQLTKIKSANIFAAHGKQITFQYSSHSNSEI